MRHIFAVIFSGVLFATAPVRAGTVLDFWHDYTPPQTDEKHHGFHLANYKRGLFFGSCGISTRSLQWGFTCDLAGDGPVYEAGKLTLTGEDLKPIKIVAGRITIDGKQTTAVITLEVEQAGRTNQFIGNGTYRIKPLK